MQSAEKSGKTERTARGAVIQWGTGAVVGAVLGAAFVVAWGVLMQDAAAMEVVEITATETAHRVLRVDRIEDDWVVLEVGEGRRVDVPLSAFPEGLKEGEGLVLVKTNDTAALASAKERIERLRRRARGAMR